MDTVISLLGLFSFSVLSTLPQLVVPQVPRVTSSRAVVEMVSADSRIFSGESVRLKCSAHDFHKSSWDYLWFRGSEQLPQLGEHLILWNTKVRDSGKYYCQGVRDTLVGNIHTLKSLPLEINVDGGWAILQVPPRPNLVGDPLKVTCRLRHKLRHYEVILYKDGVEVTRQEGRNPHFHLTNLTLEDQGMYSCRVSWDADRRTRSFVSVDSPVQVLEIVSQPHLEIVTDSVLFPVNKMKLICRLQYNARAPAPPMNYYFYKDDHQLGTATSENHDLFRRTPGQYSCKARVRELGITRWSDPKPFGQVAGPQTMSPPALHPRDPLPLAPPIPSPDLFLSPSAEPTAARPSPHQSTAAPTLFHPTAASIHSSYPPRKPSQSAPSILQSTVQSSYQAAAPFTISMESGDISGESGDGSGESGDGSEESGDDSEESGDDSEESGDYSGESGDSPETVLW